MSGRDQVSDFSTFGQAAVAAKCLKVHRRAGEIPANLPRVRLYCGEQTSKPAAASRGLLSFSRAQHPLCPRHRRGPGIFAEYGLPRCWLRAVHFTPVIAPSRSLSYLFARSTVL